MNRKEITESRAYQISKAALAHTSSFKNVVEAFEAGAEWADKHPRKGLWDSQKVIDYIYNHAHVRTFGDIVIDDMSVTEFIETMKQEMEE